MVILTKSSTFFSIVFVVLGIYNMSISKIANANPAPILHCSPISGNKPTSYNVQCFGIPAVIPFALVPLLYSSKFSRWVSTLFIGTSANSSLVIS